MPYEPDEVPMFATRSAQALYVSVVLVLCVALVCGIAELPLLPHKSEVPLCTP